MGRFCYCSKVLPEKSDVIRNRKASKKVNHDQEDAFWNAIGLTGFSSWLQPTAKGDFMIHCLEGESLEGIFKGLREQIQLENPIALDLHAYYLNVFGKDYSLYSVEPEIECLLDMKLPIGNKPVFTKGFIYPLLTHKEEEHRKFRQESNGEKKARHMASLAELGIRRLTSWLQTTAQGKYIVSYTEQEIDEKDSCKQDLNSPDWEEIYQYMHEQTGLPKEALSPVVEIL